ncbi:MULTISPECIES: hypothetical protein [Vibrio]|uniref:hypothetical protein n=1 Tax=Vibrio TaxID=662 RepID=UPI00077FEC0F|nr:MULTISPECIES: hypothetical protein [Vibrio]ELV8625806.1 hypothetical protein [Vibrio cidicii]KYN82852.1 hypothetical protein ATY36_12725 [Vibrio cidicii]MBE3671129.1 hypothetical protein [Vibrio navarrensis]MBE4594282.1 hypothetical protein [Vibrio navarrensis]
MKAYFLILILSVVGLPTLATASPDLDIPLPTMIDRLVIDSRQGDAFLSMETNSEPCPGGYFVAKSHPGYDGLLSMLLAAYQAHTPIIVSAYPDSLWPASRQTVCELHSVTYP